MRIHLTSKHIYHNANNKEETCLNRYKRTVSGIQVICSVSKRGAVEGKEVEASSGGAEDEASVSRAMEPDG